jgi:hypothetical protein
VTVVSLGERVHELMMNKAEYEYERYVGIARSQPFADNEVEKLSSVQL